MQHHDSCDQQAALGTAQMKGTGQYKVSRMVAVFASFTRNSTTAAKTSSPYPRRAASRRGTILGMWQCMWKPRAKRPLNIGMWVRVLEPFDLCNALRHAIIMHILEWDLASNRGAQLCRQGIQLIFSLKLLSESASGAYKL